MAFDPGIALHGFFPGDLSDRQVAAGLDAAAAQSGFTLLRADAGKYPTRRYGDAGAAGLPFSYSLASPWSQLGMFRADRADMDFYGPERLSTLFLDVCEALQMRLARTDPGNGHGLVQEAELGGELRFVDWFQFFGPSVVSRWGSAFLRKGPFAAVRFQPSGSVCILLTADPRTGGWSRQKAANYLRIPLKPIRVKLASGRSVDLPWG